jgi:hypothetical protein
VSAVDNLEQEMSAISSYGFNTFMNVAYEPKPKNAKAAILSARPMTQLVPPPTWLPW